MTRSTITTNKFTVDLDDQWESWGYSRKDKAVDYLKRNFKQDLDYYFTIGEVLSGKKGQPRKVYMLTVECAFKMVKILKLKRLWILKMTSLISKVSVIQLNKRI